MGLGTAILHYQYTEISINYMGLGAAIPQYAEIRENRTGLGSAVLPCPHVEIRDNHICLV